MENTSYSFIDIDKRVLKHKIYHLVEKGSHGSKLNLLFDYSIMTLIVLNVVALILDTVPIIKESAGKLFWIFEVFSVTVFTIEYGMRIYVSDMMCPSSNRFKSALKFIFSILGLIDLLAILPFYLPFLIKIDLRFLRVLRLMRFIRVFKINRYNNSLTLIYSVIKEKKSELAITGFVALLILLIASFLMFDIEGSVQPDKFPNMLSCLWWAIATLTTVGYGDVYPVTGMGKFLSAIIAVLGIGLIALPTGIISAGFIDKIGKSKQEHKKCPHCGKEIN
jgi:voltage-gated potassium channel